MKATMSKWSDWIDITEPDVLNNMYRDMLKKSGFKILGEIDYHFQPQGYTKLFLLAESHFAIHTFPEEGKTYIELSSCNEAMYNNFLMYQGNDAGRHPKNRGGVNGKDGATEKGD